MGIADAGATPDGEPPPPPFGSTPPLTSPSCDAALTNKSSVGCEYYAVMPDTADVSGSGGCFAAFVTNASQQAVKIAVDRGGKQYDMSKSAFVPVGTGRTITFNPLPGDMLPPGEVAILFLARIKIASSPESVDCPSGVVPADTSRDATVFGSGFGQAFHITTSAPVVAYDEFPYGGGASAIASATLLLPTSAWDTNYIAVSAYPGLSQGRGNALPTIGPQVAIVAAQDKTTVTFRPTVPINLIQTSVGIANADAGVPQTYVLSKGQVLQISQGAELTGTPILADKPIGVWGGYECLTIPTNKCCCDSAHQQLFPVRALGDEYVAVRFRNRFDGVEETPPWRLVGAVDDTQLTYDPVAPPSAPASLAGGQIAEFRTGDPFIVRSQDRAHPIYAAAYMDGCAAVSVDANADCRGDPEFVNVVPTAQFDKSYTFFADPTYPETNLVIIRKKGLLGYRDVTLDCAGVLSGWQPIGTGGAFEFIRFDLSRGNFEKQGACDNGRHTMSSEEVFGVTVWGWGSSATGGRFGAPPGSPGFFTQAVSYGYPAGAGLKLVNSVIVPPK